MIIKRVIGVFRLDPAMFEEVEHDQAATGQAALVVALVAVLVGLGSGFTAAFGPGSFAQSFAGTLVWAFAGWILWAAISYLVGVFLLGGKADLGEMLRVVGFAMAPLGLAIIPCLGGIIGSLWALSAAFIAVRQGLDIDNLRALITILAGYVIFVLGYVAVSIFSWGAKLLF